MCLCMGQFFSFSSFSITHQEEGNSGPSLLLVCLVQLIYPVGNFAPFLHLVSLEQTQNYLLKEEATCGLSARCRPASFQSGKKTRTETQND